MKCAAPTLANFHLRKIKPMGQILCFREGSSTKAKVKTEPLKVSLSGVEVQEALWQTTPLLL